MDATLYTTSFTLYSLPLPTPAPLLSLLIGHEPTLKTHASRLQQHLTSSSRRPAYEAEEEQKKLGSLRSCDFAPLPAGEGVVIAIIFDQAVYKFILYTCSQSTSEKQLPLLLVKANASFTRRVLAYLSETFQLPLEPQPLKLPSFLLLSTLQEYIVSLRNGLDPVAETESMLSLLRDIIGTLRITVSVNTGSANGSKVAPALRTIDLDVSSEALHQLLERAIPDRPGPRSKRRDEHPNIDFLSSLRDYITDRTGLKLPVTPETASQPLTENANGTVAANEPALRVTRIQSTAVAISMEGRLKLSSKPVEMMDAVPGLVSGDENVVKGANQDLLQAIVREAEKTQNPG